MYAFNKTLDKKTLIMLISCAVEGSSNANIFCLTKKFEESRNHADKDDYSVDCSMPLIKGNTEILKELKRVGIQISLDSLPAIIADNGPTVLSSIDAVMEGKTPLLQHFHISDCSRSQHSLVHLVRFGSKQKRRFSFHDSVY